MKIFSIDYTMIEKWLKDWCEPQIPQNCTKRIMMQMVNEFPFSLNRLLIKDLIHLCTCVTYGELIPFTVVRIVEFKEAPSMHAINCKINWKFV